MTFKAHRPLNGEYGHVDAGQLFTVPDHMAKELEPLEASGVIERYVERPRFDRKMFTTYQNKAITDIPNKQESVIATPQTIVVPKLTFPKPTKR